MSSPVTALYGNFLEVLMEQPDTVRDIHALIDELDKHLIGMQRLIDEGRKIRAELVLRLGQAVANRNDP